MVAERISALAIVKFDFKPKHIQQSVIEEGWTTARDEKLHLDIYDVLDCHASLIESLSSSFVVDSN